MIFDLGSPEVKLKQAKVLKLDTLVVLPICMGCLEEIKNGDYYFVNDTGALTYHPRTSCEIKAKENQLSFYKDY